MKLTTKKLLCVLFSLILIASALSISAYADEPQTDAPPETSGEAYTIDENETEDETTDPADAKKQAEKTLKQQRKELKDRMEANRKKLEEFDSSAKETEEYIDALDEKIGYLNEELTLLDGEVEEAKAKSERLSKQIKLLKREQHDLESKLREAQDQYTALEDSFRETYQLYCTRLRAIYISGVDSPIEALLTSGNLTQFFDRLEMVKAVSKSDSQLLQEVRDKMDAVMTQKNGINEKQEQLEKKKNKLDRKRKELKKQERTIADKQQEIADKKVAIAQERAESDRLFAEYAAKAQLYTEFRNEDEELVKQVNDEIDALLSGLKSPDEVTTVAISEQDADAPTGEYESDSPLFSSSNAALSLTYPVPGYYGVSAPFGHYSNGRPHTGIDFPCPVGSEVVAAQKGIVITVKRLDYSYGYYVMIYHGTDASGRKIVTLYAHNSSILVSPGQSVIKGQKIAESGSTGNSTGPHCHFEVIIDGTKVNPKNYLVK